MTTLVESKIVSPTFQNVYYLNAAFAFEVQQNGNLDKNIQSFE